MTPGLASLLTPLLRRMDAESAHGLALRALSAGLVGRAPAPDPILATTAFGLRFASPIGLAAGFDKNAVAVAPLMRLGFGFIETGTVTPKPQIGNPRPRIFRLEEDGAVINRLGFNNAGLEAYLARLRALPRPLPAPLGANIGVNKEGADPLRDYPALYAALAPLVDYVVVNVSSPNTPGLRDLQGEERLAGILAAIAAIRAPGQPPVLVKIAPDLADAALPAVVEACVAQGAAGLIISNTTLGRPESLRSANRAQAGGLSGLPLMARSTAMLAECHRLAGGRLGLIGVGGIATAEDVLAKLRAGASLVQLYSAFAYAGPALIPRLNRDLAALLRREGFASITDAIGRNAGHGGA